LAGSVSTAVHMSRNWSACEMRCGRNSKLLEKSARSAAKKYYPATTYPLYKSMSWNHGLHAKSISSTLRNQEESCHERNHRCLFVSRLTAVCEPSVFGSQDAKVIKLPHRRPLAVSFLMQAQERKTPEGILVRKRSFPCRLFRICFGLRMA
jgi:hypothetical protein